MLFRRSKEFASAVPAAIAVFSGLGGAVNSLCKRVRQSLPGSLAIRAREFRFRQRLQTSGSAQNRRLFAGPPVALALTGTSERMLVAIVTSNILGIAGSSSGLLSGDNKTRAPDGFDAIFAALFLGNAIAPQPQAPVALDTIEPSDLDAPAAAIEDFSSVSTTQTSAFSFPVSAQNAGPFGFDAAGPQPEAFATLGKVRTADARAQPILLQGFTNSAVAQAPALSLQVSKPEDLSTFRTVPHSAPTSDAASNSHASTIFGTGTDTFLKFAEQRFNLPADAILSQLVDTDEPAAGGEEPAVNTVSLSAPEFVAPQTVSHAWTGQALPFKSSLTQSGQPAPSNALEFLTEQPTGSANQISANGIAGQYRASESWINSAPTTDRCAWRDLSPAVQGIQPQPTRSTILSAAHPDSVRLPQRPAPLTTIGGVRVATAPVQPTDQLPGVSVKLLSAQQNAGPLSPLTFRWSSFVPLGPNVAAQGEWPTDTMLVPQVRSDVYANMTAATQPTTVDSQPPISNASVILKASAQLLSTSPQEFLDSARIASTATIPLPRSTLTNQWDFQLTQPGASAAGRQPPMTQSATWANPPAMPGIDPPTQANTAIHYSQGQEKEVTAAIKNEAMDRGMPTLVLQAPLRSTADSFSDRLQPNLAAPRAQPSSVVFNSSARWSSPLSIASETTRSAEGEVLQPSRATSELDLDGHADASGVTTGPGPRAESTHAGQEERRPDSRNFTAQQTPASWSSPRPIAAEIAAPAPSEAVLQPGSVPFKPYQESPADTSGGAVSSTSRIEPMQVEQEAPRPESWNFAKKTPVTSSTPAPIAAETTASSTTSDEVLKPAGSKTQAGSSSSPSTTPVLPPADEKVDVRFEPELAPSSKEVSNHTWSDPATRAQTPTAQPSLARVETPTQQRSTPVAPERPFFSVSEKLSQSFDAASNFEEGPQISVPNMEAAPAPQPAARAAPTHSDANWSSPASFEELARPPAKTSYADSEPTFSHMPVQKNSPVAPRVGSTIADTQTQVAATTTSTVSQAIDNPSVAMASTSMAASPNAPQKLVRTVEARSAETISQPVQDPPPARRPRPGTSYSTDQSYKPRDIAADTRDNKPDMVAGSHVGGATEKRTPEVTTETPPTASSDQPTAGSSSSPNTPNHVVDRSAPPTPAESVRSTALQPGASPTTIDLKATIVASTKTEISSRPVDIPALASQLVTKVKAGDKHFDIRLDPPDAGQVDVHLSVASDGRAQAHIIADKPQTLDVLQRDSASLHRALKDAGLDVGNNSLNFSLKGQERGDGGAPRYVPRTSPLTATEPAIAAGPHAFTSSRAADGRLDIRV
jgi:flagellar hook-length control protein FliK